MKIAHVVATPDGAPWMIALAREQKNLGHDVVAILPSLHGSIAPALAQYGISSYAAPVSLFAEGGPIHKLRDLAALIRLLRRLRPDVVHSHIVASVVTARIASWLADVPAHFSGNVHPSSMEWPAFRELELGTAFCDTKTIASCTYTRDLYRQHGVNAELVYYAVDQRAHDPALAHGDAVRRELGISADTPVVGIVAYFYAPILTRLASEDIRGRGIKGHDVLLRAVPHVLEQIPEAKFVLVGRGWGRDAAKYEESLKQLARDLGVAHAVLFPGERNDVPDVLASFDVSVHCSLTDNLGGTVESLLMERPMVVSDIGGFRDTVLHEQTGLVVPKDDPHALADAMVRLLRDRDLARRLGRSGRAHMLAHFTLAHSVAGIESLLSETTARAKDRYRIRRTIARSIVAPFRLLPTLLRARRAMRS